MSFSDADMIGETLEAAALRSVRAAADVGALDEGIIEVLRRYARQIDTVTGADAEVKCRACGEIAVPDTTQVTKALYLGPHYVNALRELGLTPAARQQSKPSDQRDPRDEAMDELEKRRKAARGK